MSIPVSTLINNSLFFGAALLILFVASFILSRKAGRMLGLGAGLDAYAAKASDQAALRSMFARKTSRIITLLTALLALGLVGAAVMFSLYEIDVAPRVWAWFEATFLRDRVAVAWLLAKLLGLVLAVVYLRTFLRFLVGLAISRFQARPTFLPHNLALTLLQERIDALLRWGMILAALSAAGFVLSMPAAFNDPLLVVTYVLVGVLVARTLAVIANLAVDIGVQLIRTLEDKPGPLRYLGRLGRLDQLANITKRTLEYFCFVGVATVVVSQLRPDTWLADTGLMLIRLIAVLYIGRVFIDVFSLILREVLLSEPEKRTDGENKQRLTLVPVATSVVRYFVYFTMAVMVLEALGVDTSPILAGAGLLGLAVGLGAQTLVGDIVSGFFILFEGTFLVGDRVRIGDVVGNVEEIGVRVLKVRDEFGVLHCIPNGEVRLVANHAREYVNAVVEFSLPYDEDIPGILDHLRTQLSEKRSMHPDILSDTDFSIQGLQDTGALIRSLTRVKPGCDDSVGDVIRVELFALLTSLGVMPSACYVLKTHQPAKAQLPVRTAEANADLLSGND